MIRKLLRPPVVVAALMTTVVATAGAAETDLGPWYRALVLPPWKPPDLAFGPVWTVVFILCAVVGVRCWEGARDAAQRRRVIVLFLVNGVLNVAWSVLFFALHRPDWGLVEVVPLWLSVVVLILGLRPIYPATVILLLPYLLWVGTAALMNAQIVRDNPPFPHSSARPSTHFAAATVTVPSRARPG